MFVCQRLAREKPFRLPQLFKPASDFFFFFFLRMKLVFWSQKDDTDTFFFLAFFPFPQGALVFFVGEYWAAGVWIAHKCWLRPNVLLLLLVSFKKRSGKDIILKFGSYWFFSVTYVGAFCLLLLWGFTRFKDSTILTGKCFVSKISKQLGLVDLRALHLDWWSVDPT